MKKKVLALVLVLVLVAALTVGFTACGGDPQNNEFKIGVLHINPTDSTSGYTYAHETGIKDMIKNLNLKDSQVIRKGSVPDGDPAKIRTAIEECIASGCKLIIGTSFGYMDTMEAMSKEYPDVVFSHGTGYKSNATNMNNYFGRIYQARYLAGVVAGLKAKEIGNPNLGYVSAHGTEYAETCSGFNAYLLGAQAVYPEAKLFVKTLGSWYDPTNETAHAEALLTAGCGVIAQHSDTENPSLAAKAKNKYSVGYNSDMRAAINDESVLTSVVWHWGVYYTKLVKAVMDGKFADFDRAYYGEFADGLFGITELSSKVNADTQKFLDPVMAQMRKGAAGRAEWDVFSGKRLELTKQADGSIKMEIVEKALKDSTGKVVVAAGGASVDDGVIKGTMNYLVEGVTIGVPTKA